MSTVRFAASSGNDMPLWTGEHHGLSRNEGIELEVDLR